MSSISRKFLLIYPCFAMDLTATKMPTSIDPQESPIMRPEKKSLTSLPPSVNDIAPRAIRFICRLLHLMAQ